MTLCTGESRGNLLGVVLVALGRGSLIPNVWLSFSQKSGIPSPGLKALLPVTMQSPLREAAHFTVPVNSLWGKSFREPSPEPCLNEGLRAQSTGKGLPTRRKITLKLGPKTLFPSWAILLLSQPRILSHSLNPVGKEKLVKIWPFRAHIWSSRARTWPM